MTDTLPPMTEKQWQGLVVDAAKATGWLIYHTYDSRRSQPGFPDLVLVRGSELVFVELKRDSGRVTPEQRVWIDALEAAGAEVWVWRPRDEVDVMVRLGVRPSLPLRRRDISR